MFSADKYKQTKVDQEERDFFGCVVLKKGFDLS